MDDPPAITRIQQGHPDGLEILVTRYQVKAISAAFLVLRDQELSEKWFKKLSSGGWKKF